MVKTSFLEAIIDLRNKLNNEAMAEEINKKLATLKGISDKEILSFDPTEDQLKQAYNL